MTIYSTLKDIYKLLSREQKKRLLATQFLIVCATFTQVLGILGIAPFMLAATSPELVQGEHWLGDAYRSIEVKDYSKFVLLAGITELTLLTLGASLSVIGSRMIQKLANDINTLLSSRLFDYYITRPWDFHLDNSSHKLSQRIVGEVGRVVHGIIAPSLQTIAQSCLAAFLSATIFILDPKVATIGISIFIISYATLYQTLRKRLRKNGELVSFQSRLRFRILSEALGGIKDTILLDRQHFFSEQLHRSSGELARAQTNSYFLADTPRYFMEFVTFSSLILLVLYLTSPTENIGTTLLPSLAIYGLAGLKLVPAYQSLYASIARARSSLPAYYGIRDDLIKSSNYCVHNMPTRNKVEIASGISLTDVWFSYKGNVKPTLHNINITIPAHSVCGIVGPSGSGKSTIADIILGLLEPDSGSVTVNGLPLTLYGDEWKRSIGYVPQSIFLCDSTITENIAFGITKGEIDFDKVKRACELADLTEFIQSLPIKFDTYVGERGVKLSGGQRQRIGIARALYHNPPMLVFDEATSSLDGISENEIMNSIYKLGESKTILLISHRLKTVKPCRIIFVVNEGTISESGSYKHLLETSNIFQNLAKHV